MRRVAYERADRVGWRPGQHRAQGTGLRYASQLQQTGRVLASMPTEPLSAQDRAALVATYREWCARQG
jgi:hypothetical protein